MFFLIGGSDEVLGGIKRRFIFIDVELWLSFSCRYLNICGRFYCSIFEMILVFKKELGIF